MDMIITLGRNSATALFSCTGCAKIESCGVKKEDRNPESIFTHTHDAERTDRGRNVLEDVNDLETRVSAVSSDL